MTARSAADPDVGGAQRWPSDAATGPVDLGWGWIGSCYTAVDPTSLRYLVVIASSPPSRISQTLFLTSTV